VRCEDRFENWSRIAEEGDAVTK